MLVSVSAKLQWLNQGNSIEDSQQCIGYTRGQETEPQELKVDQSNGKQHVGVTEEWETETGVQPIEVN
jgi:hypothetical protein